jgi:tetraacyldisaccharide 4'-kinase
VLAGSVPFPDHHAYSDRDLGMLLDRARELGAVPATTPKDAVRLPEAIRRQVRVIGVTLAWEDPAPLEALLASTICVPSQRRGQDA